jgi:hypothetical protein
MNTSITTLCFATAAALSGASSVNARSLDEVLTQDEGLSRISDGLYAHQTANSESYVAVNKAGQQALLDKLRDIKARLGNSEKASARVVDSAIAELSVVEPKNTVSGDCNGAGGTGQPQLYATASSSGGQTASGYAVMTSDFSPYTNTTNKANASTERGDGTTTSSQSSTNFAFTPASASATAPNPNNACTASASASVTCPGHSSPSISAFAFSQKSIPHGSCIL